LNYCETLRKDKPLIIGGDFNVSHEEIDIAKPKENFNNAGFTMEEREWFTHFLSKGYVDTYRALYPEKEKYTFWSYQFNAREKNIGWRIDYFIISEKLRGKLEKSMILEDKLLGSDHCPIFLEMNI
jgi:exodeoxyribonuclease-3